MADPAEVTRVDPDSCSVRTVDADRVAAARARMITGDEATQVTELFRLLGDPTRVRMLYALAEAGELCVCDLAAVVEVPETSVSHALRLLRTAGIVRSRRSGRMAYYSLDDAHVRLLLDVSAEHLRHDGRR
ncbi:MAG: ArsR/SmtB family transcription factor [Acidimicrobiales bacterium]